MRRLALASMMAVGLTAAGLAGVGPADAAVNCQVSVALNGQATKVTATNHGCTSVQVEMFRLVNDFVTRTYTGPVSATASSIQVSTGVYAGCAFRGSYNGQWSGWTSC